MCVSNMYVRLGRETQPFWKRLDVWWKLFQAYFYACLLATVRTAVMQLLTFGREGRLRRTELRHGLRLISCTAWATIFALIATIGLSASGKMGFFEALKNCMTLQQALSTRNGLPAYMFWVAEHFADLHGGFWRP